MTHKYVHHEEFGFILWPRDTDLAHANIGRAAGVGKGVSAGFVKFSPQGKPFCYGRSESLGIGSCPCDSGLLAKELKL